MVDVVPTSRYGAGEYVEKEIVIDNGVVTKLGRPIFTCSCGEAEDVHSFLCCHAETRPSFPLQSHLGAVSLPQNTIFAAENRLVASCSIRRSKLLEQNRSLFEGAVQIAELGWAAFTYLGVAALRANH